MAKMQKIVNSTHSKLGKKSDLKEGLLDNSQGMDEDQP